MNQMNHRFGEVLRKKSYGLSCQILVPSGSGNLRNRLLAGEMLEPDEVAKLVLPQLLCPQRSHLGILTP